MKQRITCPDSSYWAISPNVSWASRPTGCVLYQESPRNGGLLQLTCLCIYVSIIIIISIIFIKSCHNATYTQSNSSLYLYNILEVSGNAFFNPIPSHSQWFIPIAIPDPRVNLVLFPFFSHSHWLFPFLPLPFP